VSWHAQRDTGSPAAQIIGWLLLMHVASALLQLLMHVASALLQSMPLAPCGPVVHMHAIHASAQHCGGQQGHCCVV
jgi:hypothetical protein